MTSPRLQSGMPPSLAALKAYPLLRAAVEPGLSLQHDRIFERTTSFSGQRTCVAQLHEALRSHDGGLIALEGVPGSGVTSLLAYLATSNPFAFWFATEDSTTGIASLYAQLIALYDMPVPLIPPAIRSDPDVFYHMLEAVATQHTSSPSSHSINPVVILLDPPQSVLQPLLPMPLLMPHRIPPGVFFIYGTTPTMPVPFSPCATIRLIDDNVHVAHELATTQMALLRDAGASHLLQQQIVAVAQGNFLYVRLAHDLIQAQVIEPQELVPGIEWLYQRWWTTLDSSQQRLALLLATTTEPIPTSLCATLLDADPQPLIDEWGALGLIEKGKGSRTYGQERVSFYHWSLPDYIARIMPDALATMHADVALLAETATTVTGKKEGTHTASSESAASLSAAEVGYLHAQFARHAALGTAHTRTVSLAHVSQRMWIRNKERHSNSLVGIAYDVQWELLCAANALPPTNDNDSSDELVSHVLRLVRAALLTGNMASLARVMAPDAAVAALHHAIERLGRDAGLKQVQACVDQLPDGQDKVQVLRQLGEACYTHNMRVSAMRLLSAVFDVEEQHQELRMPRQWREQRDHLLTTLVEATLALDAVDAALEISEYIRHIEQRGMAETTIVRWLLERGELVRARKIASSISHESLTAWAQAEVAVAVSRSGDTYTAEMLLGDIQGETAHVWAYIELACDAASHSTAEALAYIAHIEPTTAHYQHGLNRLAIALAEAGKDHDALATATRISDTALCVSACIALARHANTDVAMQALTQAHAAIHELAGDVRTPLLTLLATAYVSLGYQEQATHIATELSDGEERNRAFSRIAVALTSHGQYAAGLAMARALDDDDERDWTLDEITCILAEDGHWQEAQARAQEINDEQNRARTLASLSLTLARTGTPLAALQLCRYIANGYERGRVLVHIAPMLVEAGYTSDALAIYRQEIQNIDEKSPTTAHTLSYTHISRFLAAIGIASATHRDLANGYILCQNEYVYAIDRARLLMAIAGVQATHALNEAYTALGRGFCLAITDRTTTMKLLEQAIPAWQHMGGVALLTAIAATIEEIDNW